MEIEGDSIKICNKNYLVIMSSEIKDDALVIFDDCEILINERFRGLKIAVIIEKLFHEICHGYESYFEVENLFNIDSNQKEEILENVIQLAAKSFCTFIIDNVGWMENLLKEIKKEKKNG